MNYATRWLKYHAAEFGVAADAQHPAAAVAAHDDVAVCGQRRREHESSVRVAAVTVQS